MRWDRLAAYVLPLWIVGFPSLCYWHDRHHGLIPTEAEWESAAHSSGPWQASIGLILLFSVLMGGIVQAFVFGSCLHSKARGLAMHWLAGGLLALAGVGFVFARFGYLME